MKPSWRLGCWLLLGAGLLSCSEPDSEAADLILHNGAVWTVDDENPRAQAVAVRDGRISAVGSDEEVLTHRGPKTEVIDLQGRFALPGFNDNHVHFASAGRFLEFNIMTTSTQQEFVRRVEEVVEDLEPGEWIVGGFWGAYDQWAAGSGGGVGKESFRPDMSAVEELTSRHPMFIRKFDNSEFAANRVALRAAGVDPERPLAEGIVFELDGSGQATGVMRGPGVRELFSDEVVPFELSRARRVRQSLRALEEIRKHGVTSVSDMSDDEQLSIYRQLQESGELTVRVHFRPHLETWETLASQGIKVGGGDDWIQLGAVKGHIDGIMGTSSARFFEPYDHQPDNRGRWRRLMVDENGQFVEGKFLGYMKGADAAGIQLSVHAIGDEANHLLLNYLEELKKANGERDRRFRLVHAQVIADPDFQRLGELGVVAEVQPYHLSDDMRWMEERIGTERCRGAYAFRRILESGAVLSFGTDWPGTSASNYPINPMLGLYAAVTRQTTSGEPAEGWFPDERISIEDAIRAYTLNTAHANFMEDRLGSLEVGKLADLTVLSANILEIPPKKLLDTKTLYTIVGGKIVYRSPETRVPLAGSGS